MTDRDATRRRFLVATTGAVAALAGCSGNGGGDGNATDGGTSGDGTATKTATEAMGTTTGPTETPMATATETTAMPTETRTETATPTETETETATETETETATETPTQTPREDPTDPADAERQTVDRFSESAGTLLVRTPDNGLPGPGEPIDFDAKPFFHQGLGPDGEVVQYYNFDVQSTQPAPIYALFREGESSPVEGQLNVLPVVPGDEGYNDFWRINKVTVPSDYTANTVTSVAEIEQRGFEVQQTDKLVNCPVVPEGSTAKKRVGDGDPGLVDGWYDGKVVSYFKFVESPLSVVQGRVPTSPIYVMFDKNPGQEGGGPKSGFETEEGSIQNHNVVATLPSDEDYSPLWIVNVNDNADFEKVSDLESARAAKRLATGAASVNCPLVSVRK